MNVPDGKRYVVRHVDSRRYLAYQRGRYTYTDLDGAFPMTDARALVQALREDGIVLAGHEVVMVDIRVVCPC